MHRTLRWILVLASFGLASFWALLQASATGPTIGLLQNEPGSYDGYTLFSGASYNATYLIDNDGALVHTWPATSPVLVSYLQADGTLLRAVRGEPHQRFLGGGDTTRVERVDWDGAVTWQFEYNTNDYVMHHDIEELPNGNVLVLAWEAKTAEEAIAAGRDPDLLVDGEVQPEYIIEVEPTGPTTGDIVWEWYTWDHLVQDFDSTKANYGVVADHPELIDVNYRDPAHTPNGEEDWTHANAIDYNPELDQIMVSVRHFNELWVIDHSTTTAEAAGHTGGRSSKGGDLLYRWGNPQTYGAGDASDRVFYLQHDTHWIEPGLPGAGNILLFNNGNLRPGGSHSSVDELTPPATDAQGNYPITPGEAYEPADVTWTYVAPNPTDFFASFISGAGRLPNGNTLIDDGVSGTLFEVTPSGDRVWTYVNPVTSTGPIGQGEVPDFVANIVFRAYRYPPDYPGLAGRDLTPHGTLEIVDTDGDGLLNLDELKVHQTDPLIEDTDGDGVDDGLEVRASSSPTDPLSVPATGDASCDGTVNSIDAALILQFGAGLLGEVPCAFIADANGDGAINSIDSALILQFAANLLSEL